MDRTIPVGRGIALALLTIAQCVAVLDGSIVNVALLLLRGREGPAQIEVERQIEAAWAQLQEDISCSR